MCKTGYQQRGTYRDDRASPLSHLSTFSSHLTVIIGEDLLSSFFSFTFKPKILQSFIFSQLTTWFRHDSQKTSMPPNKELINMFKCSYKDLSFQFSLTNINCMCSVAPLSCFLFLFIYKKETTLLYCQRIRTEFGHWKYPSDRNNIAPLGIISQIYTRLKPTDY